MPEIKLELTEEQYKQFTNGESVTIAPPKKKVELEKLTYCFTNGDVMTNERNTFPIEHGRYRRTQESCKFAQKRMNQVNRLSQLAHQLCGEKEFKDSEENYYVNFYNGKWRVSSYINTYVAGMIYMTEECAIEICRILNSGDFVL